MTYEEVKAVFTQNNITSLTAYSVWIDIQEELVRQLLNSERWLVVEKNVEGKKRTFKVVKVPPITDIFKRDIERRLGGSVTIEEITEQEYDKVLFYLSNAQASTPANSSNAVMGEDAIKLNASQVVQNTLADGILANIFYTVSNNYEWNMCTDILFMPFSNGSYGIYIRYQGMLVALFNRFFSSEDIRKVINRLKTVAGMDITEERRPQDGQASIFLEWNNMLIDVRIATVGTINGESLELRLLNKRNVQLTLEELGMLPEQIDMVEKAITKPYGIILTTGPTGAGKTTTLYALLQKLYNKGGKNIITIEDPVEYNFDGILQIQINTKADITFSSTFRAILRMDPDIILVGEIRDKETMQTALDAALSGHLVLSTLHANNTIATVTRLLGMDADPKLLGSAMNLILAQRLVKDVNGQMRGIFECLYITDTIKDVIAKNGTEKELYQAAEESNAIYTFQQAVEVYLKQGIASKEELEEKVGILI